MQKFFLVRENIVEIKLLFPQFQSFVLTACYLHRVFFAIPGTLYMRFFLELFLPHFTLP